MRGRYDPPSRPSTREPPLEPEERPAEGLPEGTLRIRPAERRPTTAEVNATMARLGIEVEWSDEAVQQLLEAAAAADEYLRAFPEQAETLARDPETFLREMADKGILSTPVDSLKGALAATRKKVGKRGLSRAPFDVKSVVFDDAPERQGNAP